MAAPFCNSSSPDTITSPASGSIRAASTLSKNGAVSRFSGRKPINTLSLPTIDRLSLPSAPDTFCLTLLRNCSTQWVGSTRFKKASPTSTGATTLAPVSTRAGTSPILTPDSIFMSEFTFCVICANCLQSLKSMKRSTMSFPGCSSSPDSILAAAAAAFSSSLLGNPLGWLAHGFLFLVAVIVQMILFNPDLLGRK